MPHKAKSEGNKVDLFLRSINIKFDANYPERIAHFQPTTKSVNLIKTILDVDKDRAFFITAPYGSGKSLVASYLLQIIENRVESHDVLKKINQHLKTISPELSTQAEKRVKSKSKRGLVLVLHGHVTSLSQEIKFAIIESLKRQKLGREARRIENMSANNIGDALNLLNELNNVAGASKIDRILCIWDEFGQHIEQIISNGNVNSIKDLQTLAEYASRSRKVPFSIALLLHQRLMFYASHLPQTVRKEWSKIEGRFQSINFVEDSKELFRLIGQIISLRNQPFPIINQAIIKQATFAKNAKIFKDFTQKDLVEILKTACPLDAVSLYLLPRISARVAQNERTLFSFLATIDLKNKFDASLLYDYFSSAMQADTGHGGTSKQWLETESALSKVRGEESNEKILKIACLLSFGIAGERTSAGRMALELAVKQFANDISSKLIDSLIDRKLLLYRKHSDEITVWHGTDIDLRARLEEQKDKLRREFDLVSFLMKESAPPVWRSVKHNDKYGVRRYFTSTYMRFDDLQRALNNTRLTFNNADGLIVYLLPETQQEITRFKTSVLNASFDNRVLFVLPNHNVSLTDAALEVFTLLQLQLDSDLTSTDPLVSIELQHMTDDARAFLTTLMQQILIPSATGQIFLHKNEQFIAKSTKMLRQYLSRIMDEIYHLTPIIFNELIVKNNPSSVVANARKKLEMAILGHSGKPLFGISGNFPDASMARTVLVNTGIYKLFGEVWLYAQPNDISEKGLREVWHLFGEFLTQPSDKAKDFNELFDKLISPPYGVRKGVIPILLTAAFKAFPSARSMSCNGLYIVDLLPTDIEDICKNPSSYELLVLSIDDANKSYLEGILNLFSNVRNADIYPQTADLVRECFDAISRWLTTLPSCALSTKNVSEKARVFQACLKSIADPTTFLFETIPTLLGLEIKETSKLLDILEECKVELENSQKQYYVICERSVKAIFQHINTETDDIITLTSDWASYFTGDFTNKVPDIVTKRFIEELKVPKSDKTHIMASISLLLTSKHVNKWDDYTIQIFERELRETVIRLEDMLISEIVENKNRDQSHIVGLVTARLKQKYSQIVSIIGAENAEIALLNLMANKRTIKHGKAN